MGKKIHLILAFTCALCFTTGVSAQDTEAPKAAKTAKKDKDNKGHSKHFTRIASEFGSAELTKEQKTNLTALVEAKREELTALQKEVSELFGKENNKAIQRSMRKTLRAGKTKEEAMKMAFDEAGISAEDQVKATALHDQRIGIYKGIKDEIVATFSEEQNEAMKVAKPKKGKAKKGKDKKGKGKDKKDQKKTEGDTTSVSVSLPGMT